MFCPNTSYLYPLTTTCVHCNTTHDPSLNPHWPTTLVLLDIFLRHCRVTTHPIIWPVALSYTLLASLLCDTPPSTLDCNSCSDLPSSWHPTSYRAAVHPMAPDSVAEPWISRLQPTVLLLIFSEPHLFPCATIISLCSPSHLCSELVRNLDGLLNEWLHRYTYTVPIHYVFPRMVMLFGLAMGRPAHVLPERPTLKWHTHPFTMFLIEPTHSLHEFPSRPIAPLGDSLARPPCHSTIVTYYTWSLVMLGGRPPITVRPLQPCLL